MDEGVLDPWVADWLAANPFPSVTSSPEALAAARGPFAAAPTRQIASVTDEDVDGVPVRVYRDEGQPTGLVVYLHGGGWCIGSIDIMDNMARELAYVTGAAVVSVGYRLAPEHPFPAGLDDCEAVTRWALANTARFDVAPTQVVVAGESAGGNLATAVALRLRDGDGAPLAGQVLLYPVLDSISSTHLSRTQFVDPIREADAQFFWSSYTGGRTDLEKDGFVAPLHAASLAGLPPALVLVAGCDTLRDEGRAYAARLRAEGVDATGVCYPGQPHGFMNLMFPAAEGAYEEVGAWTRARLAAAR